MDGIVWDKEVIKQNDLSLGCTHMLASGHNLSRYLHSFYLLPSWTAFEFTDLFDQNSM